MLVSRVVEPALSCLVYLDDVVVFGGSWGRQLQRLESVFQRLRAANFKLKSVKCHLLRRTTHFLGHAVLPGMKAVDPATVEEVVWPAMRRLRDVPIFHAYVHIIGNSYCGSRAWLHPLRAYEERQRV